MTTAWTSPSPAMQCNCARAHVHLVATVSFTPSPGPHPALEVPGSSNIPWMRKGKESLRRHRRPPSLRRSCSHTNGLRRARLGRGGRQQPLARCNWADRRSPACLVLARHLRPLKEALGQVDHPYEQHERATRRDKRWLCTCWFSMIHPRGAPYHSNGTR